MLYIEIGSYRREKNEPYRVSGRSFEARRYAISKASKIPVMVVAESYKVFEGIERAVFASFAQKLGRKIRNSVESDE